MGKGVHAELRKPTDRNPWACGSSRRPGGRRAYILIAVLGLTAVVATLGWAFLDAHSTIMPEAVNRSGSVRAQYLAESGVNLAMHYLMYPPTTVPVGDYWPGASGIAIDATSDYTDISISQDGSDPHLFAIKAIGVALDPDGAVRGKHSIQAKVIRPPPNKWFIPYACLGFSSLAVPPTITVDGDIHANGDLVGSGWCQGDVSAAGTATWPGTGPPASVISGAASFPAPTINPALYSTYNINGTTYDAYIFNKTTMSGPDATSLNAIDMSATNPGRIIMTPSGDLAFKKNVQLNGTLVVTGNLTLEDGYSLIAVANFPALVVTGDIHVNKNGTVGTIVGSVLCGGTMYDDGMDNVRMDVTGAWITSNDFSFQKADGSYRFTWDPMRSVFWNFEATAQVMPITVLSWKEN